MKSSVVEEGIPMFFQFFYHSSPSSLSPSLSSSLSPSLPLFLPLSLSPSLSPSLPLFLPPSLPLFLPLFLRRNSCDKPAIHENFRKRIGAVCVHYSMDKGSLVVQVCKYRKKGGKEGTVYEKKNIATCRPHK